MSVERVTCPDCGGRKMVDRDRYGDYPLSVRCLRCEGTGTIPKEGNDG